MDRHSKPTAFVHVDFDNLRDIEECYGLEPSPDRATWMYRDAMPVLRSLFSESQIAATFFLVGRDMQEEENVSAVREILNSGHAIANHSMTHDLRFRNLTREALLREVTDAHKILADATGTAPIGFRAPGYGISAPLLDVLAQLGYRYDSSIMPSPFGWLFRWADSRLRRATPHGRGIAKAQFPLFVHGFAPKAPYIPDAQFPHRRAQQANANTPPIPLELPVAASPLFGAPFQCGVCLRGGLGYFRMHLRQFLRRGEPFIFLIHAADVADFSSLADPFYRSAPVFSSSANDRRAAVAIMLRELSEAANITRTEDWIRRAD